MQEMINIAKEDLENLESRVRRLALDKSYLQLVINLINKLSNVQGLENIVETISKLVLETIGGTNVSIYYHVDTDTYISDAFGKKAKLSDIDDELVKKVFETQEFIEIEHDFKETKMETREFTKAFSGIFPLCVGIEIIGVLKTEGMLMGTQTAFTQLQPFLNYSALTLKNEILGHTKLQKAYNQLSLINTELNNEINERKSINKELEAFTYSVSHDLRSPLRAIDGWSALLEIKYGNILDEKAKDYLARVRSGTKKMGELIEDLLKLSRISRSEIKYTDVDLTALVHSIIDFMKDIYKDRNIEFIVEEGIIAKCDQGLLERVLTNLIDNACKFTGNKQQARIEFGKINDNGQDVFFVRDNGAGFDMQYADKLFGVFQRMHTTAEFPGTGIGLATVQRIIHRHKGKIWAQSEPNNGSTFYFTLNEAGKNF